MTVKPLRWLGDSLERLREFPAEGRRRAGFELWEVQQGNDPSDWKPMPSVGLTARELRVRDDSGAYRVLYVAKFAEAVYVLHAFQKKSRKTARTDMELARRRFRDLVSERRER